MIQPKLLPNLKIPILLFLLFSLSNCEEAPPPPPKKAVFVVCDFSTSTKETKNNTDSILLANANAVLRNLPPNATYTFYEVTDGAQSYLNQDSTGNSIDIYNDNLSNYRKTIEIIQRRQTSGRPNLTCINNTLQTIKSQLEYTYNNPAYEKVYLILLSDMLEACKYDTGNGSREMINLEDGKFVEGMLTLEKWVGDAYLSSMPNLEIGIVLSSGKNVSFDGLESFWRAYFKKVGYSKKIFLSTNMPNEFFQ